MSLVLQAKLPLRSGSAPAPYPLCDDFSQLISLWRQPLSCTREPAIQLPSVLASLLVARPDFPQYKGTACAFPFFRCLNLEYCQDLSRGQQEVQDMLEGTGTRAGGSKRVHNGMAPKDPEVQIFCEERLRPSSSHSEWEAEERGPHTP